MKIVVKFFYQRVCGLDKVTYAHKDLIIAVCKNDPPHRMDTDRILCWGTHEVKQLENKKVDFMNQIRNWWYKEDSDKIKKNEFIDDRDESLPHMPYFTN